MSSSDSDNGSDIDDFSVLDIIGGQKRQIRTKAEVDAQVKKETETISGIPESNTKNSYDLSKTLDDEFDINIPTIFLTDAKKNEELAKQNSKIRADLAREEIWMKLEYNRLQQQKQTILDELNDNGLDNKTFSLSNSKDKQLVEKLLQNDLKGCEADMPLQRHFYFYSNPPQETGLDTHLPFAINISSLCLQLQPDNYDNFYQNTSIFLPRLVNYVIVHVQDLNCLREFSKFVQYLCKSDFVCSEMVSEEMFVDYIKAIGGDIKLITPNLKHQLPLKLLQYNFQCEQNVLRLSIIYNYVLFSTKNDDSSGDLYFIMLKTLLLSLSDFNLNERSSHSLADGFVSPVFTNLLTWRRKSVIQSVGNEPFVVHDFMLREINNVIDTLLVSCLYSQRDDDKVRQHKLWKVDYELRYNVLRLLRLSLSQFIADSFSMRLVVSMCLSFMSDNDYTLIELYRRDPTMEELDLEAGNFSPHFEYIVSILNNMNELDFSKDTDSNDLRMINLAYKYYYKLLLLNLVIFKTFHSNLNTIEHRKNFEKIKKSNFSLLVQMLDALRNLKEHIHRILGQLSNISLESPFSSYKDDVIHIVTEHYHLLLYLTTKFDKDVMLLRGDTFYEDRTLV